jgi:hypothetical protein
MPLAKIRSIGPDDLAFWLAAANTLELFVQRFHTAQRKHLAEDGRPA